MPSILAETTHFLGRVVRLPLRLVPKLTPLPILTGSLKGKRWLSTSGTHGCWLGAYEKDLQNLMVSHLRSGNVFFDIGANVGFFTLLGATLVGANGRVFAFEPLERNVFLLLRHLHLNHVDNVTLLPVAVADTAGTGWISTPASPSQGALATQGVEIQMVTLDDLIGSGELPMPDVLKIDVEGAELRVLQGARQMLSEARPMIFLSTHGYEQHGACWQYLEQCGYELALRRDGTLDGQYEITAKHPDFRKNMS